MSLIGLLTATEKQVRLGRLHMRPIQWHLKRHWRVPESLVREIPVPRTLHPHLQWWTRETNVLLGQPLHPLHHAVQIFTDASKEGWGAHLGDYTTSGTWSVPESHLHVNFLELKAVFLALKKISARSTGESRSSCHRHKQGGRYEVRLTLCPSMAAPVLVQSETCSKGQTYPRSSESDCGQILSTRPNQTEWSLHQEVFDLLCQTWHHPQVDMFVTRYSYKLAQYVSPVPDPTAWAVDALTVSW